MMGATKLKNLSVTSVDLVDQGANPDAHIRLFKRRKEAADGTDDPDRGLFEKFVHWMTKGFEDAHASMNAGDQDPDAGGESVVEKDAQTFMDNFNREIMEQVIREMHNCTYALADSFCSILCDSTLAEDKKKSMMLQSMDEFSDTVRGAIASWAKGNKMQTAAESEAGIQKSKAQETELEALLEKNGIQKPEQQTTEPQAKANTNQKEVTDTMKIDKSKMTPEEQATLAEFEKKYGVAETDPDGGTAGQGGVPGAGGVEKGAGEGDGGTPAPGIGAGQTTELHPDVAKALADFQELAKKQNAEVEELKKNLEIERLNTVAKKYEVLGKKSDELAAKLYDLKKAGGTVYDDYVTLLDEILAAVTKGGLFSEIGSNRQGSAGTEQTLGIKAAELAKSAQGMTSPEAIMKAFEENPELAAQYEAEYRGR